MCPQCKKTKRSDCFPKDSIQCSVCSKGKAKTVINVPIPGLLTANALSHLHEQKQEIGPNDSLSVIGGKRQRELMEDELQNSAQEDLLEGYDSNGEVKQEEVLKRQNTSKVWPFSAIPAQATCMGPVLVVSHTDAQAIEKLKEIEQSKLPQAVLSLELQSISKMFHQETVIHFLREGDHPVIASLIPSLFARGNQLSTQQNTGILLACMAFKGKHWSNAVTALGGMKNNEREEVLDLLKVFVIKMYGKNIGLWLTKNWESLELWHFQLIEHLKDCFIEDNFGILQMALILSAPDITIFTNYSAEFAKMPCSSLVINHLKASQKQIKLQFEDFVTLTDALMQNNNASVIERCKKELLQTPLTGWVELIEKTASTVHLSDKGSVQEAIKEFIQAYGQIDETFSTDLFQPGSPLALVMRETQNQANYKQLGLSHYCIGGLRKVERQLWCVPSGDGKSRIMAFACLIGLDTRMFKKIYLVFDNEHLMQRDKADFEDLWRLSNCQDKVEYRIGYAFEAEEDSLILIDESDRAMFESPKAFADFVDKKFCICFTATPSNCDQHGVEAEVIKTLGFKQYEYMVGQPHVNATARLQFDEINHALTIEQKVQTIGTLLKQGSVIVYAPEDLYEKLQNTFAGLIVVDKTIDPLVLRQLDKAPYKLLVCLNQFGMRGMDYRSKSNTLFLVVAQQFPCVREALQGVARVGRFGDPYRKIKFADCQELIDLRRQAEYNARLLSFIGEVKKRVLVKPAQTSQVSPKKSQPTQGSRFPLSRSRNLLGQPPTGQVSLVGFFKPPAKK